MKKLKIHLVSIIMNKKQITSILLMLTATLIWGTSFVAQTDSTKYMGPLTFMAARSFVGAFALLLVILIRNRIKKRHSENSENKNIQLKRIILIGLICGGAIALATGLQQWGIYYNSSILGIDTSGKGGFLTATYIIFVPIFSLFFKKSSSISIFFGAALGFLGMYLLCIGDGFFITLGDVLLIGCALAFTVHILVIDLMCKDIEPILLSFIQFLVAGLILTPISILTERNIAVSLGSVIFQIIYLGVFSSAIAYTIQIVIQKNLHPAVASLIMSFESVFATIAGAIFLNEKMTFQQIIACIVIFLGMIVAQFGEYIIKFFKSRFHS